MRLTALFNHPRPLIRLRGVTVAAALAAVAAGCSSADLSVSAPSAAKCQVTVDNSLQTAPSSGATGVLSVTTTRDCAWDASSAAAWIVITEGSAGQGAGEVRYRVAPNGEPVSRQGSLRINDTQLAVRQEPAPCRFIVSPTAVSMTAAGGSTSVGVQTSPACAWTVMSEASWIAVGGGSQRNGGASLTLTIAANTGAERTGTVRVADQLVSLTQAGGSANGGSTPRPSPAPDPSAPASPQSCASTAAPAQVSVAAGGGSGSIAVTATPSTCGWTAVSSAPWLAVSSGSTGTGSGSVEYVAAPNSATVSRTATLTVAGRTVTVTQAAAPCTYAIAPTSVQLDQAERTVPVAVTAPSGCSWTATRE